MRLFIKILFLFVANYFHDMVYMPFYLIRLELQWPGMIQSLRPEPVFQAWLLDFSIVNVVEIALLYGLIHFSRTLLFPAVKRIQNLLVARLAPRLSLHFVR